MESFSNVLKARITSPCNLLCKFSIGPSIALKTNDLHSIVIVIAAVLDIHLLVIFINLSYYFFMFSIFTNVIDKAGVTSFTKVYIQTFYFILQ